MSPTASTASLQRPNPAGCDRHQDSDLRAASKRPVLDERQLPLAVERVRYPGEAVAMVVAESAVAARDAAEAVEVEYDVLPAVTDVSEALADGAPIWPWPDAPDNVALDQEFGDRAAVEAAFARAPISWSSRPSATSASSTARWSRAPASAPTTRRADCYTLISGNQGVHAPRMVLAEMSRGAAGESPLRLPRRRRRLRAAQQSLSRAGSRSCGRRKRVGRPVKWTNDRSESFLTDYAGARSGHHGAARARPQTAASPPITSIIIGTTGGADRHLRAAQQRLSRRHHRLRHPADAHALPLGDDQHGADRAVPRRRPAGGDRWCWSG